MPWRSNHYRIGGLSRRSRRASEVPQVSRSKQLHLRRLKLRAATAPRVLISDLVFPPQRRHQQRQALRISLRQKCAALITLLVAVDQGREVLRQKRQKNRR